MKQTETMVPNAFCIDYVMPKKKLEMFRNFSALLSSASSIVCALFHWQKGGRNTFNVPLNSTLQRSLLHSAPLFVQNTKIYVKKFSFSTIVKDNIPRTKCITLFAPRPKYFILENYNTDILKFLNRLKALGWKASMYYLEQRLRLIFVCCRVYIEDMKIDTLQQSQDEAFLALVFCLNFRGNLQMLSKV